MNRVEIMWNGIPILGVSLEDVKRPENSQELAALVGLLNDLCAAEELPLREGVF